jgi:hypothetical protein
MRARVISHLRCNVVSYLALSIALGGTSYAAVNLPKNSVGTQQLRTNAVTTSKLHNGAVTGSKVAKHSLTGKQIISSTLGTVPNASRLGGAPASAYARVPVLARIGQSTGKVPLNNAALTSAQCAPGEQATGGGVAFEGGTVGPGDQVLASFPIKANGDVPARGEVATGWAGSALNGSTTPRQLFVWVLCISG